MAEPGELGAGSGEISDEPERPWRLFVAIPVPDDVRSEIWRRLAPLRERGGARWVAERNLHLTLAFLGHRPPAEVPTIVAAIESVAAGVAPFVGALGDVGTFGGGWRGYVLWLGMSGGRQETAALATELERLLRADAGEQRRPRPHVTLAREAEKEVADAARAALAGNDRMEWPVDHIDLFRSRLGRGAPVYEELAAVPLAARRGGLRSGPCSCRPRAPRGC